MEESYFQTPLTSAYLSQDETNGYVNIKLNTVFHDSFEFNYSLQKKLNNKIKIYLNTINLVLILHLIS